MGRSSLSDVASAYIRVACKRYTYVLVLSVLILVGRGFGWDTDHLPTHPQVLPTIPVGKEVDEGGQGVVGGMCFGGGRSS
jgi:hypothetical protein